MLFYWYFLLCFNHYIRQKEIIPDSTHILPEIFAPDTDVLLTVRPQITFLQHNGLDAIFSIVTYVANATYIMPTFPNLPVTISTLQISEAQILHRDKQLEEFLIGEEHCHNFINQDLPFLQPSTVYETTTLEDSIPSESNSTEVSLNTVQGINQLQEDSSNSTHSSLAELFYDSTRIANRPAPIQPVEPAPIQPVEPVIGLTPEEQCRREEDPNLTLDELLGLSSCEDHISTPLQPKESRQKKRHLSGQES